MAAVELATPRVVVKGTSEMAEAGVAVAEGRGYGFCYSCNCCGGLQLPQPLQSGDKWMGRLRRQLRLRQRPLRVSLLPGLGHNHYCWKIQASEVLTFVVLARAELL